MNDNLGIIRTDSAWDIAIGLSGLCVLGASFYTLVS